MLTKSYWQCLLHRPGFQHLIAAAPAATIFFFWCSNYNLSSWHHCPNPNFNRKISKKKEYYETRLHSSATFAKRVQRKSKSTPSVWQASAPTTKLPGLRIWCVKVPYLTRINEKKQYNRLPVHQRFGVRNRRQCSRQHQSNIKRF